MVSMLHPILGKNSTGIYAESNFWIELVVQKYQKYSSASKEETIQQEENISTIVYQEDYYNVTDITAIRIGNKQERTAESAVD